MSNNYFTSQLAIRDGRPDVPISIGSRGFFVPQIGMEPIISCQPVYDLWLRTKDYITTTFA